MTIPQALALAIQHHHAGRLPEAEALYRQILAADPRHADSLHLLGVIAHQVGRNEMSIDLIRQAIALAPGVPAFHSNLGEAYRALARLDEAIVAYRQAIALKPDFPAAHCNLANALRSQGRPKEAIAAYREVIALRPDYAEAHCDLGTALRDNGQSGDAIAAFRQALLFKPNFAVAYNNLGAALLEIGQLDEGITACRRAVALEPGYAEAHGNLGSALKDLGLLDEAVAACRQAITLRPNFPLGHSNLLQILNYALGWGAQAIAEEHRHWNRQHAEPLRRFILPHANDRDPERRLRIGYVSRDFREHSVAYFLEGLLKNHDRAQMEVFCYADVVNPDAMTARMEQSAGHWRKIAGLPDAQVAELIRRDGIDILVDLAGHTAHNRLPIFARKPAPVQVTWLGYPNTTGLEAMDYRLTDAFADPPGLTDLHYSEKLIRLAPSAWCFQTDPSPHTILRKDGPITFGCFNNFAKVTPTMLALWARILHAVPDSRLLLKSKGLGSATARERTHHLLETLGIAPERIELRGHEPDYRGHLDLYDQVDIALDTFPYHGTTTTCEALWMGVPVVSLAGDTHVSRVGASLLSNAGLPDLLASTGDEYIRLATTLAHDLPRLAHLRSTLRQRMAASPLMDAPRFARSVEAAFRQMWQQWCMKEERPRTPTFPT